MSDEKKCIRCAVARDFKSIRHTCGKTDESDSEHQRLQAEAAAMRRALLGVVESMDVARQVFGNGSIPAGTFEGAFLGVGRTIELALSSSAGAALLEEVAELRKERDKLMREVGETFEETAARSGWLSPEERDRLEVELADALSESADLRSRLETVERERDEAKKWAEQLRERVYESVPTADFRKFKSLATDLQEKLEQEQASRASEVRRAVEEEREELVRILTASLPTSFGEVVARTIRARGGA